MNSETEQLIDKYIDGTASKDERQTLVRMLKSDPDIMDAYVEKIRLHSLLREISTEDQEETDFLSLAPDVRNDPVEPKFVHYIKPAAAVFVLCFTVFFGILIYLYKADRDIQDSKRIREKPKAVIVRDGRSLPLTGDTRPKPGDTIRTGQGSGSGEVRVSFANGSGFGMGPESEIAVMDENRINMMRGRVRFSITPQKTDFKVHIVSVQATVRVVGTEFVIECLLTKGNGMKKGIITAALITVLSGTVGVMPAGEREVVIQAGTSLKVTAEGKVTELKTEVPDKAVSELDKKLSKKISFDFVEAPLSQVQGFMSNITGTNIIVDSRALGDKKPDDINVTLRVNIMKAENALFWVARKAGLVCTVKENAVIMSSEKLYPDHWKLHQKSEEETEWHKDIRAKMKKKISFDFQEMPFNETISYFNQFSGVTFIIDHGIDLENRNNVTLGVNDFNMGSALKWICRLADFDYTITREAVLVSDKKDIKGGLDKKLEEKRNVMQAKRDAVRRAKEAEMNRQVEEMLKNNVSINFENADIGFVFTALRKMSGVNIVLAPAVVNVRNKEGQIIHRKERITINVNNTSLKETLNIITKQIPDVTWKIKNGAVYVFIPKTKHDPLKRLKR